MATAHAQTVQNIYACFGRQDIPGILEHLSPEVEWEYAYPERGIPWLSPRRGREGAAAFFQSLAALDFQKFAVNAILSEGDLVVALVDAEFVVKATGKRIVEKGEVHLWHFDAHGRVSRFRHAVDTLQHAEALRP